MARKLEFDRDDAVKAAADTFWEKGYAATSLDDLTGRLGIGRASLYNAFGDKHALLEEALATYVAKGRETMRCALADNRSGRDALSEFVVSYASCDGQWSQGCLAINVGVEMNGADPLVRQTVVSNLERLEDTLLALISRGQADGTIRADLDAASAARALNAGLIGIQSMKRIGVAPETILATAHAQLAMI